MSLGQLTANYTDSEGEDDEHTSVGESSHKSTPIVSRVSELRDDGSRKETPLSVHSVESGTNTPQKKLNRLVSYANEDDDEDEELKEDERDEEPDEELNSEPMDTGSDEGEDDKSKTKIIGIKLPSAPPGKCAVHLQDKVNRLVNEVRHGNKDYNAMYQSKKEFRNPGIYEKLIELLQLDEMGTNYPLDMFDPHCWGKESYYDELARVQKEEMDKREKERKEKSKVTKVDYVSGTKKPVEEERKRKSRFDQGGPSTILKPMVAPPTLTSVPSGTKTTIDAFGSLKKTK